MLTSFTDKQHTEINRLNSEDRWPTVWGSVDAGCRRQICSKGWRAMREVATIAVNGCIGVDFRRRSRASNGQETLSGVPSAHENDTCNLLFLAYPI